MLRLDYPEIEKGQISLIESLIPKEALKLPPDLEKVDQVLIDERFEEPFIEEFNVTIGRGTVPVRVFIRLMLLKYSNEWGYETLEYQVNQNLVLKKFCRIPLDKPAPDSTTLIKLNQKYGEEIVKELNKQLMKKLTNRKIIRGRKLRVDTTVVESNIHYPTDASLLKDCVDAIASTARKIKDVCGEAVEGFRSKTRTIKGQLLKVVKVLGKRTGEAKEEANIIVKEMVNTAKEAHKAGKKIGKKLKDKSGKKIEKLNQQLDEVLSVTQKIIEQTGEVLSDNVHISDRVISIHDQDARPIKKGKPRVKAEFGYKVQIEECENGFVSNYEVYKGNPSDDTLLDDAIERHESTFDRVPESITADRGYGSKDNEVAAKEAGIKKVAIPKRGKKSKERQEIEYSRPFKRLINWRAGIEARISLLKRKFGLDKSYSRGHSGTGTWVGWGILSHNLLRTARYV